MENSNTKSSSIRDNHNRGSVGQFLRDNIQPNADLSIVSAYFTIYAYQHLKPQLDAIQNLRFLFGEPSFLRTLDPSKTNKRDFKIEDDRIVIPTESRLTQKSVAKECAEWIQSKVEIKSMVKPNFLHGKLYLIENTNGVQEASMGSSNFTVNGLGLGGSPNIELNMVIQDRRDLQDLKAWFNELWGDQSGLVQDVKIDVLKYLEQFYIDNEPEFIYYKTLYHVFEKFLDEQDKGKLLNEKTGFYDTEIWGMLYKFQQDGVKGAINKILNFNGCVIADSVGLGKTFEALAVIRYFELLNQRVLVLCPKKLSENWTVYQSTKNSTLNTLSKDQFKYHVLYHTDIGRLSGKSEADGNDLASFNWGIYDLVVIDESHHFRGNPMEKENSKGEKRMNRALWLMEKIIKSGTKTKVLLLSATPVNNNLRDLRNQIYLITEGRANALEETTQIKDIGKTLQYAQQQFTSWADSKNRSRNVSTLLETLGTDFTKLLDTLTIARSRKHINSHYRDEMDRIGSFPERAKPLSIYSDIDLDGMFLSYDRLQREIEQYELSIFRPSKYVEDKFKLLYTELGKTIRVDAFTQDDREKYLIGMMKVNFLKRLESSVKSFEVTMKRCVDNIVKLENKIKNYQTTISEDTNFDMGEVRLEGEEDEELNELFSVGKKLKYELKHLNLENWLADLKKDKQQLNLLLMQARDVTPDRDAKLRELKNLISSKILQPATNQLGAINKKVLIFTAFADTATYLYDNIATWAHENLSVHSALVTGGSANKTTFMNSKFKEQTKFNQILTNFSPISKNRYKMSYMPQEGEIDILIATDCISEGQNLQDCDYIINYDIHWNPVRIIQRFGRIDRLGSKNDKIQLVNFWPTKDLDTYLNLKERVEARMALVDITATGEDNVLNTEQIEELITEDLKYRNQQLKRLKDEVLDLEDMEESISLTDFTLDDFRVDLMNYLDANKEKLRDAPMGLYAVVPAFSGEHAHLSDNTLFTSSQADIVKPGVIYCLRQLQEVPDADTVNPLQPYFLVYVRNDGTVRFNFMQSKQVLEMFRMLCSGKSQAYSTLCELFNNETNNGTNMDSYSKLLIDVTNNTLSLLNRRNEKKLEGRGGKLIDENKLPQKRSDFELITWLILK